MQETTLFFLFRGAERILIMVLGGFCIYWGYKLFNIVISDISKDGELTAEHGETKISLRRVAPGVFFALFGATILSIGLFNPLNIKSDSSNVSYLNPTEVPDQTKNKAVLTISAINQILYFQKFGPPKDPTEKSRLDSALNTLTNHRRNLIDTIVGVNSVASYIEWSKEIVNNPDFISKLSVKDQEIYKQVKDLLETL
jgi:hypothetical protein